MRSVRAVTEDLTARARIRHSAIVYIGRHGWRAATVRAIAGAAGVSPALVIHHFGSKDGLREACDTHVTGLIDRGIASGEFFECDSHVVALGYIGMTLGAYRWLRPDGRRSAQEIAAEFSTALLRGLIRDDNTRVESPLGEAPGTKAHA